MPIVYAAQCDRCQAAGPATAPLREKLVAELGDGGWLFIARRNTAFCPDCSRFALDFIADGPAAPAIVETRILELLAGGSWQRYDLRVALGGDSFPIDKFDAAIQALIDRGQVVGGERAYSRPIAAGRRTVGVAMVYELAPSRAAVTD